MNNTHAAVAENIRLAEALGADTLANMNYEDASVAPNAAYASARAAFGFAAVALGLLEAQAQKEVTA